MSCILACSNNQYYLAKKEPLKQESESHLKEGFHVKISSSFINSPVSTVFKFRVVPSTPSSVLLGFSLVLEWL